MRIIGADALQDIAIKFSSYDRGVGQHLASLWIHPVQPATDHALDGVGKLEVVEISSEHDPSILDLHSPVFHQRVGNLLQEEGITAGTLV